MARFQMTFNSQQELLNYIQQPKNYVKTRTKIYEAWLSYPPLGTKCRNILTNAVEMTTQDKPFLYGGTVGEIVPVSAQFLQERNFVLAANGAALSAASVNQLRTTGDDAIKWVKIRSNMAQREVFALFVPLRYVLQLPMGMINAQGAGAVHGRGDFIVCQGMGNTPNLQTARIVHGTVFRDCYNNTGLVDYLDMRHYMADPPMPSDKLLLRGEGLLAPETQVFGDAIEQLCKFCATSCHPELPFKYRRANAYTWEVRVPAISLFNDKIQAGITSISSKICIQESKKVLTFEVTGTATNGKVVQELTKIQIPLTPAGLEQLKKYSDVYFGVCGFVNGRLANCFKTYALPQKLHFDAVAFYTTSSGTINRVCRGADAEITNGALSGSNAGKANVAGSAWYTTTLEYIQALDELMDFSVISNSFIAYRGAPYSGNGMNTYPMGRVGSNVVAKPEGVEKLSGCIVRNTTYTSTTLNLWSTIMFACPKVEKTGVVFRLNVQPQQRALWSHSFACWGQQYEVLFDRSYDIAVGSPILKLSLGDKTVYLYDSVFTMHQPGAEAAMPGLVTAGLTPYDNRGRVPLYKQVYNSITHKAMQILKRKGASGVELWCWGQANSKKKLHEFANKGHQHRFLNSLLAQGMIMFKAPDHDTTVKVGDKDVQMCTDVGFSLQQNVNGVATIGIFEVSGAVRNVRSNSGYGNKGHGDYTDYSYPAKEFRYPYKPDEGKEYDYTTAAYLQGSVTINQVDSVELRNVTPQTLADFIVEYTSARKDLMPFPLQDIARYIDITFQHILMSEGYYQYSADRIERVTETPDNPQSGHVPFKYIIDGDDDNHLCIRMRLSRGKDGELHLAYNGRSRDGKVNEEKQLSYSLFDNDAIVKFCYSVLNVFISRLKLSCTAKAEQFMAYYARSRRLMTSGPVLRMDKGVTAALSGVKTHNTVTRMSFIRGKTTLTVLLSRPDSLHISIAADCNGTKSAQNFVSSISRTNIDIGKDFDVYLRSCGALSTEMPAVGQ